jgi:hypothetical protein
LPLSFKQPIGTHTARGMPNQYYAVQGWCADFTPYLSMGIIYIDEIDKIARKGSGSGTDATRDVGGEGVQQSLLRIMEGSVVGIQSKGAPDSPNAMRSNGRPAGELSFPIK